MLPGPSLLITFLIARLPSFDAATGLDGLLSTIGWQSQEGVLGAARSVKDNVI